MVLIELVSSSLSPLTLCDCNMLYLIFNYTKHDEVTKCHHGSNSNENLHNTIYTQTVLYESIFNLFFSTHKNFIFSLNVIRLTFRIIHPPDSHWEGYKHL